MRMEFARLNHGLINLDGDFEEVKDKLFELDDEDEL